MDKSIDIVRSGEGICIDIGSKSLKDLARVMAAKIMENSGGMFDETRSHVLPLVVSEGDRYEVPHFAHMVRNMLGLKEPLRVAARPGDTHAALLPEPPVILVIMHGESIPVGTQTHFTHRQSRIPRLTIVLLEPLEKNNLATLIRSKPEDVTKIGGFTKEFSKKMIVGPLGPFRWKPLKERGDLDIRRLFDAFIGLWSDAYDIRRPNVLPQAYELCLEEVRFHKHRDVRVIDAFAHACIEHYKSLMPKEGGIDAKIAFLAKSDSGPGNLLAETIRPPAPRSVPLV